MTTDKNFYADLASIDVSKHVEQKGKFSYLSWTWAVDQLRRNDPTATWEVKRFQDQPYMKTECGYFVEVAVTCLGTTLSQIHPVLDNNNRPIAQPNSFQINTSIQRCLVKAIALHGLGLYIYAGEDLPEGAEPPVKEPKKEAKTSSEGLLAQIKTLFQELNPKGDLSGFDEFYAEKLKKAKPPEILKWLQTKKEERDAAA